MTTSFHVQLLSNSIWKQTQTTKTEWIPSFYEAPIRQKRRNNEDRRAMVDVTGS